MSELERDKWRCEECEHVSLGNAVLSAPNPFDPTHTISGCPVCLSVSSLVKACDEFGCEEVTTCGTPTPGGYRRTCGKHAPRSDE